MKDNVNGMLYAFEFIKHGAVSNFKTGKIARGKYELKNWYFYTIKTAVYCSNFMIWLFILYGILKLFI